ncbi:MAG: hypothetical protein RIR97_242 [Pseudomonadota bacterium]
MITTEIAIILVLLLINAFFSLSEMAIVSASKPLLRQKARQGDKRAIAALKLAEDSGNFLSTVQVGITLVGTLAGAYGGAALADKLSPWLNTMAFITPYGETVALALVVSVITYFSVTIGELIPKQLALANAEVLAMLVARPMTILSRLTAPLVILFEASAHLIMRVFGFLGVSEDQVTEAEVQAVVAEGAESGAIEKTEHDMMRRIIALGDRSVKSIMTHRTEVVFLNASDTLDDIRRRIETAGHSRYPVIANDDDEAVIGAVSAKDILESALTKSKFALTDHLQDILTLPESATCLKALELFKTSSTQLAIIVDEYGSTEGIITSSDLLEAIVGILPSNYDDDEHALIFQRDDGSYLIDGRTPIEEMKLTFGFDDIDAEGDFETIAGFLVQQLRKTPQEGDMLVRYGYRFEVIDMDSRRIDKILMQVDPGLAHADPMDT